MNKQKEYNKILNTILEFENIATAKEKKDVFMALRDYLKRSLK